MINQREELIKSALKTLKVDLNPFNIALGIEQIEQIRDEDLGDFYKALFEVSHNYKSGMEKLMQVSNSFKKQDETHKEAKLIFDILWFIRDLVMHEAEKKGEDYIKLFNALSISKTFKNKFGAKTKYVISQIGKEYIRDLSYKNPSDVLSKITQTLKSYSKKSDRNIQISNISTTDLITKI